MKNASIQKNFDNIEKNIYNISNLDEESEVRKLIRSFEFNLNHNNKINNLTKKILIDYLNGKINNKYHEIISKQYQNKNIFEIYKLQYFEM